MLLVLGIIGMSIWLWAVGSDRTAGGALHAALPVGIGLIVAHFWTATDGRRATRYSPQPRGLDGVLGAARSSPKNTADTPPIE